MHSGKPINLTIAQPEDFIAAVTKQNWPIQPVIPEMKIS
jgi:hypothetical protein